MSDAIYGKKVPENARGKSFLYSVYEVSDGDDGDPRFVLKWEKKAVEAGVEFIAFDEEEDANLEDVDLKTVKEGKTKYFIVLNAAKTAENNRLEEARQQLKKEAGNDATKPADTSDIEKIIEGSMEGGSQMIFLTLSLS